MRAHWDESSSPHFWQPYQRMESSSRKRLRRSKDSDEVSGQEGSPLDQRTGSELSPDVGIPPALEARFATAIFELGLKHSSPKIIMPLMPTGCNLSTEHIKSHLQKYRIHRQRSKDEFVDFFNEYIKGAYLHWNESQLGKRSASAPTLEAGVLNTAFSTSITSNLDGMMTSTAHSADLGTGLPGYFSCDSLAAHASSSDGDATKPAFGYAADLFAETDLLLQSLQDLYQEAGIPGGFGEAPSEKPAVAAGLKEP